MTKNLEKKKKQCCTQAILTHNLNDGEEKEQKHLFLGYWGDLNYNQLRKNS